MKGNLNNLHLGPEALQNGENSFPLDNCDVNVFFGGPTSLELRMLYERGLKYAAYKL